MRYKKPVSFITIFLALFFIFIPKVYSIRVPPPFFEQPILIITYLVLTIIINIIIEYGVVYIFLRSGDLVKKELFYSVVLVNLVIFPPTHIVAYFILAFLIELYLFYTIIIAILMLLTEWLLYRLEFQKLFYRKSINKFLSLKRTVLISTLANFTSFSLIYLPFIILMIQYGI